MINMRFMQECEKCPYLEVKLNSIEIGTMSNTKYNHIITCEHIEVCQTLKEYLRKEMNENGKQKE